MLASPAELAVAVRGVSDIRRRHLEATARPPDELGAEVLEFENVRARIRSLDGVDDVAADLFEAARAVQANAHVPYSGFAVGAAVRTASGRIFAGANVENAAFPEGICAEASAIGAMVSAGEREIVEVLTVADGDQVTTCCGGCRQKLREFAGPATPVHAAGPEGVRRTFTLEELLPTSFGPGHLQVEPKT